MTCFLLLFVPYREMYATAYDHIYRASMDGSNFTKVLGGLRYPHGIVLDRSSSRLYWTDGGRSVIESSNTDGSDVQTIVPLPDGSFPIGLVKWDGTLYWSNFLGGSLQSSMTSGGDIRYLYNWTNPLSHVMLLLESTEAIQVEDNVGNPCDGHDCSHICALRGNSFRCLCPRGMHLDEENMRTCLY